MGAKNLVTAYIDATTRAAAANDNNNNNDEQQGQQTDTTDKLFTFLSSPEGQQLAVMAVASFASNGMRVYMDKSLEVNFYEDMFSSMSKPQHLEAVKQCVGVFARDVVASYLQGGNNMDTGGGRGSGSGRGSSGIAIGVAGDAPVMTPLHEFVEGDGNVVDEVEEQQQQMVAASAAASLTDERGRREEGHGESSSCSHEHGDAAPTNAATTIEEVPPHALVDDLDSDSLLHTRKKKRSPLALLSASSGPPRREKENPRQADATRVTGGNEYQKNPNTQWIAAVGKEWLNVSKDPDGRHAVAAVVGTATREVTAGVSAAVLERFSPLVLWAVLLMGVLMAMVVQRMGSILFH